MIHPAGSGWPGGDVGREKSGRPLPRDNCRPIGSCGLELSHGDNDDDFTSSASLYSAAIASQFYTVQKFKSKSRDPAPCPRLT